uniref:Uncharacterized protein n=1 Tax=Acrobeloides nanus TaxID=290746 RepID=A0A914DBG6_9BILA
MIYLIILLALTNFYATDALPTKQNKEESLLSCFMRCSLKPGEPIREKRQVDNQKVANQIVSSWKSRTEKLRCLANSQSAIIDSISGLKCNEAIENFKNDGVSKQFYNKIVVSGQSLCELFSCPAEAAKDSVEDSCKDFVYDILRKFGDMYYYDYAFGVEEGKNLLRSFLDYSTGGTHTGEK